MATPKPSSARLDIIIVGAGLSGLAAAISCTIAGHTVTVVESAKELAGIGGGIQVTPNATRLFQQWGVYDVLQPEAAEPTFFSVHRYSDGKLLALDEDFNLKMRRKYNAPLWELHRVDLQRALVDRAKELGVKVRLGAKVTELDFDTPSLTLEGGETLHADLLVGADGMWSKCRERFLAQTGQSDAPLPTGDLAYRIALRLDELQDPELREWVSKPSCRFWIGPGSHAVGYSLRGCTMYNLVLLCPDNLPPDVARQPGSIDEMRKLFSEWDPILNRFLDNVKSVDKWKLMHRPELDSWISEKSTFVFVGDSCHPMLPYLAQGANSSMEDGAVLGNLLGAIEAKNQLPEALRLYQRLRKERGEAIVKETFAQRHDSHMLDGPEQQARDELYMSQLGKEVDCKFPMRLLCPEVQPWLFGYDAQEVSKAALKEHPYGVHEES